MLAVQNLWAESHLVLSSVNLWLWGNIAMVAFFARSLGKIAQAVASRASNYYARDLITGLWRAAPVYLGLVRDHFSHFFPYNDPLLDRVTPPPSLNLAWAISPKFANLMGQKNTCGIAHSYFNPTLNICPWRDSSCHLAKIDDNSLGTSSGDMRDENFKGDRGHFLLI